MWQKTASSDLGGFNRSCNDCHSHCTLVSYNSSFLELMLLRIHCAEHFGWLIILRLHRYRSAWEAKISFIIWNIWLKSL